MLSRLSSSQLLIKSISTKDSIYICKLGQNTWTIFSNSIDGDLSKSTIISRQLGDDLVDEYFLLLSGKIIFLCLITRNEVLLINPFTSATVQATDNTNKFSNGIYHSGLGESLIHNGRELYSLVPINGMFEIKEKPWSFYFDNIPWKSWGDFQSEIITNLYTFDSEKALRSSFTLIIEYRVCSTGFPIMHWTTLSPADNKVIINWRIPLLFPDVAVSLFFDNHGVETCMIFNGNVLFIGNAQGLTQAIDWKAFGAITAFGGIHVVGEKCFFLSAYHSGGIHGNEIDLKEGTVAVSPIEGALLYSSVELPIVRKIHPIISNNWKQSNFETFAIIGDPFVGYSFIYTDSFAARASPEYLAAVSRIFDCPSYGTGLSLATFPSFTFHTRHALFFEEEEVLQTVRSVRPLRLTGSYIIEGMPLTDFQLVPMENIPSLCSHSADLLFVLTSRSFSCSSLLRFSDQGLGFEAIPGILVENDATLAVFKVSDRRVLQVTSRQVQCFSINAAKQFVLETKFDVSYSGKQQFNSKFPTKILKVARYREMLWLVCDAQCLAKLDISKLPTIDVSFTRLSPSTDNMTISEISAINSIRVSMPKPTSLTISPSNVEDWLATAFWESNQIQIQRVPSKVENEVTGTLPLPVFHSSQVAHSNHSTVHQLQFLSVPNKGYVLLAISQSNGYFLVYALHCTTSIQAILLISCPLDAHTSEITFLHDNCLLVRTIAKTYYEIKLHWESASNKNHENVDIDRSFPDSITLFNHPPICNDHPHPKLAYTIRTFSDLSCCNLHPFTSGKALNNLCSFIALSSPELLSTGKSQRELSLQQIPQQQTLLQQLLVIQGEIDLNTQSYQSLAVSERFLKIDDVLEDDFPQQLLVLHWVPPTNYHAEGMAGKGEEEEEVTMMQRIDVLDSVSLKPLRHLHLELSSFPSVSRDKVRFSIWSDVMQQLLGEVGIVTSLSMAPTNRYMRDTALMTRHLHRIEYWRYLQQQSVSADNHNKRRGSKNNDQTVVNDSNNVVERENSSLVTDLRPLTLVIVETMKRPKKSQRTQVNTEKVEHHSDDDDSEDDEDKESDSDYDPPDHSPALNPSTIGANSVEDTTAEVIDQHQNTIRRKRKASSSTDSSFDSTLHVVSFLYPASDTISMRNSASVAPSSAIPQPGIDTSHGNNSLNKLNLIPLDCTQWSLTHCDLLRHRPACASISTGHGDRNNNSSDDTNSSKNPDEHLAILTIDGTLSIVGWTVSLLPTPDSLRTGESTAENVQFTLDDLAREPLRKGELTLKRLTHIQSSLQPMVPPKYEVDYSDVHRTMETLGKLNEERAWRKMAKPQLICRENIAVVYVPRVGFELYRLVTAIQTQHKEEEILASTLELEVCAVIKDTIDFERLFVLTQSNEVGDVVVKIFGHDRMMTRAGREDRAMRLHSFVLSADARYSSPTSFPNTTTNTTTNNNVAIGASSAMRRDMFSPLPRRASSYTAASYSIHPERMSDTADKLGIHAVQWGTSTGSRQKNALAFADFVDCMDVEELLQMCTIVDDSGEIEWGRDFSAPKWFVEQL